MAEKHGDSHTRLYKIYKGMKNRCYHPSDDNQRRNYYERGIRICDDWLENYVNFKNWALANGYRDDLTIERINNAKGYSPENCNGRSSINFPRGRGAPLAFSSGRGAPAGISLRAGSPRWHIPPGTGSVARPTFVVHAADRGFSGVTAPSAALRIRNRTRKQVPANAFGAHRIQISRKPFPKACRSRCVCLHTHSEADTADMHSDIQIRRTQIRHAFP